MDFNVPAQLGGVAKLFELLCEYSNLRRARFIAIELLALLYEDSDFILRFLPNGGKLPPVLDFVLEDEFRLLDPFVQPADILPHSIAGIPGLFRQRPHLVQVGKVESPQAGKPAGLRFPKKEQEAVGWWMFFPSPAGRLGVKDAALEGLRGVLLAQGLKPHGAPIARQDQRGVFAAKPKGIALLLQRPQELLPCEGSGGSRIEVLLDGRFPCGRSILLGQPLDIGAGNLFRFLGVDNREMVFPAQFVGNLPHLCDIGSFIAAVFPAVFHGHGIPDNVVVDAFGVEMGADYRLKLSTQQPIRKFQPDLVCQFRGNLPGSKALHQMEALHAFFLVPHFLDAAHILKSRFTGAAEGGCKQILLGFVFVEGLIDFPFQRFLVFPAGTFLLVEGIVNGVVEAVDGDNTGVSDRLPILLYFFPNLTGQLSHFLDILLAGFAVGIGDLGKLVGVVAKPGYLVEQIRMVIAGPCPQFRTHDKGAEEFLTGQAACFHLRFQMGQFLFVQVEGDDVVSFSHGEAPFNALALSVSGFPSALTDENIHYCEFGCGNPYSENFQAILLKNENFPPDLPGEIYGLCTFQGRLDAVS